jgi:hypothetical protein
VLDLVRCRRALVMRQVEGSLNSMNSLAGSVGISRSTATRFFSGRPTSLSVTLRILGVLKLKFEDVARPESDEDDAAGPVGVGAMLSPRPGLPNGHAGAALRLPQTGTG